MRAATLALLTLHGVLLVAQDRPQFRAATRLVQVSVVVHDKTGRPISGLAASDFRLYDGNQEQRIELFSAGADTTPAREAPGTRSAAAAGVHEFSNRQAPRGSATVILFDRLNTLAENQLFARQQLLAFLQQITADDRVGIYVLEGDSIRVLHDFTNDARSLMRAFARYRAMTSNEAAEPLPPEPPDTGDAALDAQLLELLERASSNMTEHFTGLRSDATIAAFQAIANHLAAVDGRKNLIWITGGFPLKALTVRGISMTREIQRATRPLNDANVTLYAVDARGLVGAMTNGPKGPVFTTLSSVHTNVDILQIAADETGGRAFFNSNDINGAVRRAVDDARVTYTLGYYPSHGQWNGAYRQIKVRVNRPDVDVRHRKGYLAAAGAERLTTAEAMRAALLSPLESRGIELTARLEPLAGTPNTLRVVIMMAPGAVAFERAGETWNGTLDVAMVQKLADGSVADRLDRRVDIGLEPDRYEETLKQGFAVNAQITLRPDLPNLHIIVHDVSSGHTGSIVVPADKLRAVLRPERM